MSRATVVRYTTRPDAADDNEQLIRAVFAQLEEETPAGLRYAAVRLDDGVSFVHIALLDDEDNPLLDLPAFGAFTSAIASRCVDGPTASQGAVIGDYSS
jgi:hypothetical protein